MKHYDVLLTMLHKATGQRVSSEYTVLCDESTDVVDAIMERYDLSGMQVLGSQSTVNENKSCFAVLKNSKFIG